MVPILLSTGSQFIPLLCASLVSYSLQYWFGGSHPLQHRFPNLSPYLLCALCAEAALGGQRERLGHPVQAQQGGCRGEEDAAQVQELGTRQGQNQQYWHYAR